MAGTMTDILVTDGKLMDWSDRGVPPHIEVYDHDGFVAFWDAARRKHVACAKPLPSWAVEVAMRQLGQGR
jgi:hypothetical protein